MKHFCLAGFTLLFRSMLNAQVPDWLPTTGLVAWYPFNANALDESGNGHDLTVNGATLTADRNGQASGAFHFDGSNSHMNGGSNAVFEITGDRTISVWVNIGTTLNDDQGIVGYIGSSGALAGHAGYYLKRRYVDPNIIGAYEDSALIGVSNYGAAWSNAPVVPGQWHHLVHWRSGGITQLWVDGLLQSSSFQLTPYFLYAELLVGWSGSAGQYYNGEIDDIGIWDSALTPAQIAQVFAAGGPGNCLIASYPFDGNALDTTGNGHDGTVFGATPATDRFGNAGGCYQLDGVDDLIDVTSTWAGSDGTISAWIYLDDLNDYRPIFTHFDTPNLGNSLAMNIDPTGAQDDQRLWSVFDDRECNGSNGHLYSAVAEPQLTSGEWIHVAMSADATSNHLYINCTEVATYYPDGYNNPGLWFSDMCSGVFTTFIGRSGEDYFKGRIDDVRIYNCALDPAEISALCDLGTAIASVEPRPSLSIYPNPTSGPVTITGEGSNATSKVEVIDAQGHLVATIPAVYRASRTFTLDLSGFPNDLYTIRCGGAVRRVVKMN